MALHGNPKPVAVAKSSHGSSHSSSHGTKRSMGGVKRGIKPRQHGGVMRKGKS